MRRALFILVKGELCSQACTGMKNMSLLLMRRMASLNSQAIFHPALYQFGQLEPFQLEDSKMFWSTKHQCFKHISTLSFPRMLLQLNISAVNLLPLELETFTASRNILVTCMLSYLSTVCELDRIAHLKLKYLRVPQCGQHSPSETVALAQEIRGQDILRQTVAESCKSAQI